MNFKNFLWSSCLVGLLSFGGGKAFIPIYQKLYVESYHFLSMNTLQEYIGYAVSFPGPISPMITGLVGFFGWGMTGFFLGILVLTIPPIIVVYLAYRWISRYQNTKIFQFINLYFQAGILALLFYVILEFFWGPFQSIWSHPFTTSIFCATFFGLLLLALLHSRVKPQKKIILWSLKYLSPILGFGILGFVGYYAPLYRNFSVFLFLLSFSFWGMMRYRIHPLFLIIFSAAVGIFCIQI